MPRKREEEEPIIVNPNEPLRKCYDCIHWELLSNPNNPDAVDFSSGSCNLNGYSKCPPLFTCPGWASGNGEIADTLSLLMSN